MVRTECFFDLTMKCIEMRALCYLTGRASLLIWGGSLHGVGMLAHHHGDLQNKLHMRITLWGLDVLMNRH